MRTLPFVLSAVVIAGCAAGHREAGTTTSSTSASQRSAAASSSYERSGSSASTAPSASASNAPLVSNAPVPGAAPSASTGPSVAAAPTPSPAPDTSVVGAGAAGSRANAKLAPTAGNNVSGSVQFVQAGTKVTVSGEVRGLKPNSEHGFHVHEKGDCSAPDGTSAGGHFNPDGKAHGKFGEGTHHRGDLKSLKADGSGVAKFEFDTDAISVGSGPGNVVGKGLIVHADPDDFKSQPAGNSGARVACAVITKG